MATSGHFKNKSAKNISGLNMVNPDFKAPKFDKKQNSLLLANIMHIARFFNLSGADMPLSSCSLVTYFWVNESDHRQ